MRNAENPTNHLPGEPMPQWQLLQSSVKMQRVGDTWVSLGIQLPPDETLPYGSFLHFNNGEQLVSIQNNEQGRDSYIKLSDGTLVPFELWQQRYLESKKERSKE